MCLQGDTNVTFSADTWVLSVANLRGNSAWWWTRGFANRLLLWLFCTCVFVCEENDYEPQALDGFPCKKPIHWRWACQNNFGSSEEDPIRSQDTLVSHQVVAPDSSLSTMTLCESGFVAVDVSPTPAKMSHTCQGPRPKIDIDKFFLLKKYELTSDKIDKHYFCENFQLQLSHLNQGWEQ